MAKTAMWSQNARMHLGVTIVDWMPTEKSAPARIFDFAAKLVAAYTGRVSSGSEGTG